MVQLDQACKDAIKDRKSFLQKNDLYGFYQDIYDAGLTSAQKLMIGLFLEGCGIKFEDYLDCVPCHFCYAPKSWIKNGTALVIPPHFKRIEDYAFANLMEPKHIIMNVETIEDAILADSQVQCITIGDKIKHVSPDAFDFCWGLNAIQLSKNANEKVKRNIKEYVLDAEGVNNLPKVYEF